MPDDDRTNGWAVFHKQMLDESSSFAALSLAHRAIFIAYILLARYDDPYRGCLCSADGEPFSWRRKARGAVCSPGAIENAEESMLANRLITKRQNGVIHISNYSKYQRPQGVSAANGGGVSAANVSVSAANGGVSAANAPSQNGGVSAANGNGQQPSEGKELGEAIAENGGVSAANTKEVKEIKEGTTSAREGKADFNSDTPPAVQQDTGRPYDEMEIAQVIQAALPESVWRELKSLWSNKLTRILNADTEPLTLTDIYTMLQEYPPTLDQRYPDGWLRQARYKRDKQAERKDPMDVYHETMEQIERERDG